MNTCNTEDTTGIWRWILRSVSRINVWEISRVSYPIEFIPLYNFPNYITFIRSINGQDTPHFTNTKKGIIHIIVKLLLSQNSQLIVDSTFINKGIQFWKLDIQIPG